MWKCRNCQYTENEESFTECHFCEAPRGFDPEAETKIMPAVMVEDRPRVGSKCIKK